MIDISLTEDRSLSDASVKSPLHVPARARKLLALLAWPPLLQSRLSCAHHSQVQLSYSDGLWSGYPPLLSQL